MTADCNAIYTYLFSSVIQRLPTDADSRASTRLPIHRRRGRMYAFPCLTDIEITMCHCKSVCTL